MGDIADYYFERDDFQNRDGEENPATVQCKFCKTEGLRWVNIGYGFRLFDEDYNPHNCRDTNIDAFDKL